MEIFIYVGGKLIGYSIWAWIGLYLLNRSPKIWQGLGYGFLRLVMGFVFGVIVFFTVSPDSEDALLLPYLMIYTPLRWFEWSLLLVIMTQSGSELWYSKNNWRMNAWRVGGILISYALDFLSPEGMEGRFCVGRCLC